MSRTKPAFLATLVGAFCLLLTPALAAAGTIEGTVTDETTAGPIEGVNVCAFVIGTDINACDDTDPAGEYAVTDLPANSHYKVEFNAEPEYEIEYYDDKSSWIKSTSVAVVSGQVTTGIDAQLTGIPGGQITGTVTDEATAGPIEGVNVCAFVIGTDINACDDTDPAGEYAVTDLPANSHYKVEFNAEPEYEIEYYDDKSSWIKSTSVAVVSGQVTTGIDAQLTAVAVKQDTAQTEQQSGSSSSTTSSQPANPPAGDQQAQSPHKRRTCPKGKRGRSAKGGKMRSCSRRKANSRPNAR